MAQSTPSPRGRPGPCCGVVQWPRSQPCRGGHAHAPQRGGEVAPAQLFADRGTGFGAEGHMRARLRHSMSATPLPGYGQGLPGLGTEPFCSVGVGGRRAEARARHSRVGKEAEVRSGLTMLCASGIPWARLNHPHFESRSARLRR